MIKPLYGKFKQIPENWEHKLLLELVKTDKKITYGIVQPGKFHSNGILLIRGKDYVTGWVEKEKFFRVSKKLHQEFIRAKTMSGDILICIVGSVGISTQVPHWIKEANITQTTARISCDDKKINPKFLMYFFNSNWGRLQSQKFTKGSVQPGLNLNDVEKFFIPLPPLSEQQKIATILSNIDNLIESTGKVITHSKKVKTGLMQKLLTRGIGHVTFKKVPWLFGKEIEIPEEWEVRKLDSLVTLLTNGFVGKAKEHYTESGNGVLYIQGYNIEENNFKFHGIKYVTPQFHKQQQKSNLQLGDLLTVQTGNIGTTAIISKSLVGANCHALIISRFKKEIADSDYFCQYFNSRLCQKSFKSIEIGTSLKHLNGSDMKRLSFLLPPLPEQQKIATILSNIDSKITSQEQYKEKLERLKKSLMQKLLTGEVRV
jgi:type I restriction enzyme, S subunit